MFFLVRGRAQSSAEPITHGTMSARSIADLRCSLVAANARPRMQQLWTKPNWKTR